MPANEKAMQVVERERQRGCIAFGRLSFCLRVASRLVQRLNDGGPQPSSFGRRHHTIAMTVKQPKIAAPNTAANERLLNAIFSPHCEAAFCLRVPRSSS